MDVSHLLHNLNDKQRDAVTAPAADLLILAGAGSGKTRVLVHRIAWLVQVEAISPRNILAVTFTNKAAREMRERVEHLLGMPLQQMWMGTFHGLANRLLRRHAQDAGLPDNFQILDADDQYRLIRRVLRTMNLDEKLWQPKQLQWFINNNKDEGLRPKHVDVGDYPDRRVMRDIYQAYQDACDLSGLVDFAELLLRTHELLLRNPPILGHYQQRFRAILVDEFQDTNNIQYAWLRLLCSDTNNMMIVGDDDQSIYGWRGANVQNIQHFVRDFPNAKSVRLEQNYRSTGHILKAANGVIDNNTGRMGKTLWTSSSDGDPVFLYAGFNEVDEARFIISQVESWVDAGGSLADNAVLYRSNAQSRVIEEALLHANVSYRIYGGVRFFDRQEVKDALGYMRMVNNPSDDAAFERIINVPPRGLGEKSVAHIRETARNLQQSLWQASLYLLQENGLAARAAKALQRFVDLIFELENKFTERDLEEQAKLILQESGILAMYQAEKGEKGEARVENLQELVTACKQYVQPEEDEELTPLAAFLAQVSLDSGETQAASHESAVQLMTIHTAKGLEFSQVFLTGMEEGMFPSAQSASESERIEEERRLCYVGMTRAMKKLFITYAESRRLYGQDKYHAPSRFIREMPNECIEEVRLRSTIARPAGNRFSRMAAQETFEEAGFSLGDRVKHPKFAEGTVLNCEGSGNAARVQVNFDQFGCKWLMLGYAALSKI